MIFINTKPPNIPLFSPAPPSPQDPRRHSAPACLKTQPQPSNVFAMPTHTTEAIPYPIPSPSPNSKTTPKKKKNKRKLRTFEDRTYKPFNSRWRESMEFLLAPGERIVQRIRTEQERLKEQQRKEREGERGGKAEGILPLPSLSPSSSSSLSPVAYSPSPLRPYLYSPVLRYPSPPPILRYPSLEESLLPSPSPLPVLSFPSLKPILKHPSHVIFSSIPSLSPSPASSSLFSSPVQTYPLDYNNDDYDGAVSPDFSGSDVDDFLSFPEELGSPIFLHGSVEAEEDVIDIPEKLLDPISPLVLSSEELAYPLSSSYQTWEGEGDGYVSTFPGKSPSSTFINRMGKEEGEADVGKEHASISPEGTTYLSPIYEVQGGEEYSIPRSPEELVYPISPHNPGEEENGNEVFNSLETPRASASSQHQIHDKKLLQSQKMQLLLSKLAALNGALQLTKDVLSTPPNTSLAKETTPKFPRTPVRGGNDLLTPPSTKARPVVNSGSRTSYKVSKNNPGSHGSNSPVTTSKLNTPRIGTINPALQKRLQKSSWGEGVGFGAPRTLQMNYSPTTPGRNTVVEVSSGSEDSHPSHQQGDVFTSALHPALSLCNSLPTHPVQTTTSTSSKRKRHHDSVRNDSIVSPLANKVRKLDYTRTSPSTPITVTPRTQGDATIFDTGCFTVRLLPDSHAIVTGVEIEQRPTLQQRWGTQKRKLMKVRCVVGNGEMDVSVGHVEMRR